MLYRSYENIKLSVLGMGAMRLPVKNGVYSDIDETETEEMIDLAIKSGVNYFDTAYGYHDGMSEKVMGKYLAKYPRDSFYLADKFPGYDLSNMDKVETIFEEQLRKCNVEYFDFYLFHNVCEMNINEYLDEKYGIFEYLCKQKENGRIKHLGFSVHGSFDTFKRFLDAYGEKMEFCQIQLNYIDWDFQNVKDKVNLLNELNIPIWVMEPLRGGKLATLSEENTNLLKDLRSDENSTAWAFRFLQSIPGVTVILSGMSNIAQIKDNIKTLSDDKPLNDNEMKKLMDIAEKMSSKDVLPCTACRYCTAHCPQELDIPKLISLYNEHVFTQGGFIAPMAISALPDDKKPSACIGCRSCEAVCPQQIKVSDAMADFTKRL